MPIRLSGINSGLDTDAIVKELVSAYSLKTQKYEKAQTKIQWKQDAWKSLNNKIYSLYTNVSNLRFSSAYNLRRTTISDSTKATVSASSDAVIGTQTLSISKTAQSGYLTGGKLGNDITASSTLKDLGYTGGEATIKLECNGEEKEIKVTQDMKISEVINSLKEAGVNASFDANNKRIFVNAKESGEKGDFTLEGANSNGKKALKALGLDVALTQTDANGNVEFTANAKKYQEAYDAVCKYALEKGAITQEELKTLSNSELKNKLQTYLNEQIDKYQTNVENYDKAEKEKNKLTNQATSLEKEIAELEQLYTARQAVSKLGTTIKGIAKATTPEERRGIFALAEDGNITKDELENFRYGEKNNQQLTENEINQLLTAFESEESKAQIKTVGNFLSEADSSKNALENINDLFAGGSVNKYRTQLTEKRTKLTEVQTKINEQNTILTETESVITEFEEDFENNSVLAELATASETDSAKISDLVSKAVQGNEILKESQEKSNNGESLEGSAVKIAGSNAKITLNGVEYESDSNSFTINGLTINAQATTVDATGNDNPITITTNVDTQGVYDKIKDFLTEYNTLINEMTKLYNAESAKDYEPLTDEEKDAMSDEQIEKWENKIKDALLRRDTTLNGVMSAMVNSMAQSIEIDGEKLSLSSFGISTLGFLNAPENEHYAYHIDGDEDDENTSGKTDKLMKAIEENPEQLMQFMQKLSSNLYTAIDNKMKSTELSSAYKVYNDKELDSQYRDYTEMIKKWEAKVSEQEEAYYKKFSAMEVALSKLQSQTNSLAGLLGQ